MTVICTPHLHLLEYDHNLIQDLLIDTPQSGVSIGNKIINLSGWAVGKKSAAVAIELVKQDRVILETPIQIHRPRVTHRYAECPGSEKSGFRVSILLSGEPQEQSEMILQVILSDQTKVAVAIFKVEFCQKNYQKKTFFIHVAKTAGSSFNQFLETYFTGDEHCEKYRKNRQKTQLRELNKIRTFDYISGHLTLREFQHNFQRDDYFLVTLLRNPVHQVISHLNWVYYVGEDINSDFFKNHPAHDQEIILSIRKRNLSDYREIIQALLEHQGLFLNNQSRYFQTSQNLNEYNIIENLKSFDLVGMTENYKQFVFDYIKLQKMNINPKFEFKNKNINPKINPRKMTSNPEFMKFINEHNAVDMKVYNYFDRQEKMKEIKLGLSKYKSQLDKIKYQMEGGF